MNKKSLYTTFIFLTISLILFSGVVSAKFPKNADEFIMYSKTFLPYLSLEIKNLNVTHNFTATETTYINVSFINVTSNITVFDTVTARWFNGSWNGSPTGNLSDTFVPYAGAVAEVNLGAFALRAANMVISGIATVGDLAVDYDALITRNLKDSADNKISVAQLVAYFGNNTFISNDTDVNISSLQVEHNATIGSTLFVDSVNNRVGIGTTEPQTALHIATDVGSGVKLERGALDARWWGASGGPAYFGTISNDALNFQTNNNNRMTIASGVTGGAVDVINSLTAGNLKVDGATGDESVFNDDGVDADFRIESSGSSDMFFVDGGNNRIGIGTPEPNATLYVVGDTNTTGTAEVGRLDVLATATTPREVLFHGQVSDAPEDRFAILQATSAAGAFGPLILGSIESVSTNFPIGFIGQCDDSTDTGTTALVGIVGRKYLDGEDWNNPASGFKAIDNRPILVIRNKGTVLLQIEADGQLYSGGAADANIRIDGSATGNPYLYFLQSGSPGAYLQYVDAGAGTDYLRYDAPKHRFTTGIIVLDLAIIPTSDPNVEGQLWRDGTDLKISLG